ncbi:MAG: flagellar basal body rod protein FlgB [Gammaproteobacteria bacterium CG22_combo_CG10-13_8_21_14_all_40_8]|nr:MAG: flagellar basal body rod protein FlgB [Gammaproteobacteria bacterium CG22_combo_CG10-13_8_21_14_all_40_8]
MGIGFDKSIGMHSAALLLREQRAEVLASNIANADTPGYKAKDLDFKQALEIMKKSSSLAGQSSVNRSEFVKYRVPNQPDTGDGNTVDMAHEKMAYAQNALDYQTSFQILDGRIKGMMKAIRGE